MLLGDLDKHEQFIFHKEVWTKLRKVRSHSGIEHPHDIFDCMNEEGRHRPFRDDVEVEPRQRRLEV